MLKFEKAAKIGQTIRAYDFKPMAGREDCFVEGVVLEENNRVHGYNAFKIRVTKDVFDGKEFIERRNGCRVGDFVYVPHQASFMEYDARIINLSE